MHDSLHGVWYCIECTIDFNSESTTHTKHTWSHWDEHTKLHVRCISQFHVCKWASSWICKLGIDYSQTYLITHDWWVGWRYRKLHGGVVPKNIQSVLHMRTKHETSSDLSQKPATKIHARHVRTLSIYCSQCCTHSTLSSTTLITIHSVTWYSDTFYKQPETLHCSYC